MTADPTELGLTHEIPYREIGVVSRKTKKMVLDTITEVFKRKDYTGVPPSIVSISQGAVVLPSKEEIPGCYNFFEKNKPGNILISAGLAKTAILEKNIPIEVATAAVAAHEAMEHVNFMAGRIGPHSGHKIPWEIHSASITEKEANSVAREVIRDLYGYTIHFAEEQ
jgi:hypothetical protein